MRINAQMAFSPRKREDIILRGFYNLRRPICEFLVFFFFLPYDISHCSKWNLLIFNRCFMSFITYFTRYGISMIIFLQNNDQTAEFLIRETNMISRQKSSKVLLVDLKMSLYT